ncbi:MAG: hypothetical protein JOY90_39505 [Bradyrhizobium sp.]|uniref:hypothetical protein n=1 Tax=Bradyrhizobium sp. TaxID=376 RepID=UPI001D998BB1|nr:hypothetical protein [Bradyrhizobium sp.]MBV9566487.1 hypothetical protein [Bradyrhizobium sp.]
MEREEFRDGLLLSLRHALQELTAFDQSAIALAKQVLSAPTIGDSTDALFRLTPAGWVVLVDYCAANWTGNGRHALDLFGGSSFSYLHPKPEGVLVLVHASFALLAALAAEEAGEANPARLSASGIELAGQVEAAGLPAIAHRLLSCLFHLLPAVSAARLPVAEKCLQCGEAAGQTDLVAAGAAACALCRIDLAGETQAERLAAFEALELAIERISAASEAAREQLAVALVSLSRKPENLYLQNLLVHLVPHIKNAGGLTLLAGKQPWPARVTEFSDDEDETAAMEAHVWALRHDLEVDRDHLGLLPVPALRNPTADWLDWTLSHPAYLRAVPNGRSFLEEKDAQRHLLDFAHEVTHVKSLLGYLGLAMAALRAVLLHRRINDWARGGRGPEEILALRRAGFEAPPIDPTNEADLLCAEITLELVLKARALQDVWTAWMEGLAVFGEAAAEVPDPDATQSVGAALRCLVDFRVERKPGQELTQEELQAQVEAFFDDVGGRWASAAEARVPGRLRELMATPHTPYLAGYLAVRGVVAAWRARLGRPLGGPAAFRALVSATRLSIADSIPSLALRSDRFAAAAEAGLSAWVKRLAGLPADRLDLLLTDPAEDERRPPLGWRDGCSVQLSSEEQAALAGNVLRRMVSEAFLSLADPADVGRWGAAGDPDHEKAARWAKGLAELRQREDSKTEEAEAAQMASSWLTLAMLLPLGRADARFYLAVGPEDSKSRLSLIIRKATRAVGMELPSSDFLMLPLSRQTATALAEEVRARGTPRMEVLRLVDLGHYVAPPLPWPLVVLRYGDWLHVLLGDRSTNATLVDGADRDHPLANAIRGRLWPEDPIGLDAMPRGDALASHTLAQLGAAPPGDSFTMVWRSALCTLAERIGDESARRTAQCRAASLMLEALGHTPAHAAEYAAQRFEALTKRAFRLNIATSLFRTGCLPGQDPWLDQRAAEVAASGFDIFERGAHGWDVRAASQGTTA